MTGRRPRVSADTRGIPMRHGCAGVSSAATTLSVSGMSRSSTRSSTITQRPILGACAISSAFDIGTSSHDLRVPCSQAFVTLLFHDSRFTSHQSTSHFFKASPISVRNLVVSAAGKPATVNSSAFM